MSATPTKNKIRIGPAAPGFRAELSQAAAVARPCPSPQPAAAIPSANAAANPTQSVAAACAKLAGASANAAANADNIQIAFFAILSPRYEISARRWLPEYLGRLPASHWRPKMPLQPNKD